MGLCDMNLTEQAAKAQKYLNIAIGVAGLIEIIVGGVESQGNISTGLLNSNALAAGLIIGGLIQTGHALFNARNLHRHKGVTFGEAVSTLTAAVPNAAAFVWVVANWSQAPLVSMIAMTLSIFSVCARCYPHCKLFSGEGVPSIFAGQNQPLVVNHHNPMRAPDYSSHAVTRGAGGDGYDAHRAIEHSLV